MSLLQRLVVKSRRRSPSVEKKWTLPANAADDLRCC